MRLRPTVLLSGFAFLLAAGLFTACSRSSESASATANAPCVLLVTMDGLRADRLGAYGGTNTFTPVLDGLAANGVRFDHAQAVAPLSLPAQASILTGLYPPEHGLRVPGCGPLHKDVPTLASALRAGGYRTGAFLASAELGTATGLDRGFERFDVASVVPPPAATGRLARSSERMRPRAFEPPTNTGLRRGEDVTGAALAWLAETVRLPKATVAAPRAAHKPGAAKSPPTRQASTQRPAPPLKQPFFLWVQLADPAFRDAPEHTRFGGGRIANGYDAEVAYMDLQLGRLLSFLGSAGLRERTLVVVVGGYGAELGPDASADAALNLTDATLHVPWIMNCPGRLPKALQIPQTVSPSSLAGTVVDSLGPVGATLGISPSARVRSVAGALRNEPLGAPGAAYVETLWPQHAYGLSALKGCVDDGWRLVEGRPPERCAWPGNDDRAAPDLAAALARLEAGFRTDRAAPLPPPLPSAAFVLPAGVDRTAFVALWQRVVHRIRQPEADETLVDDCRRLTEARPDYAPFHTWHGIALSFRKEKAAAVEAHQRALALAPKSPHLLSNLGLALLETGNVASAIDHLEDAYLARPQDTEFRDNLATVLMNTGVALARNKAFNDAMACMTRVLLLQPDNPFAHINMGSVYQGMGRNDLAAASYRRALELHPGLQPAQRALQSLKEAP